MQPFDVLSANMNTEIKKMTHIGDNIKRIRKQSNISQQELAERCGISKSQISRLESGEQENPQIQTIVAIATALSSSLEDVVYGESAETMSYLTKAMEQLPEEEKLAIRKMIRGWILISQTEKLDGK